MIIKTNTYQFEAADLFTGQLLEFEGGSIWHAEAPRSVQVPILNFALSEIVDLTEEYGDGDNGDGYELAVRRYFDIKRPSVIQRDDSTTEVAGLHAFVRTSRSRQTIADRTLEKWHLFVNIPLDAEFMQEFSADCPLDARETYEPLFWNAIRSVSFFGNRRQAIDQQEAARVGMYERIDSLTEKLENISKANGEPLDEPVAIPAFEPTADGQPIMTLAGLAFALDPEATHWSIAALSRELLIRVVGRTEDAATARRLKLFDDDPGFSPTSGEVTFSLGLKGVYGPEGRPLGTFRFDDGRSTNPHLNIRVEGVDYGLQFSGVVTIRETWVSLQGHLGRSYDNGPGATVDIRLQLDPATLDWRAYTFCRLAELELAPADCVRHVSLQQDELHGFPAKVLAAHNLETLSLWRRPGGGRSASEQEPTPRLDVPAQLGEFTQLRELHIANYPVETLPSLRKLRQLTQIHILHANLRQLPPGLLALPKLRFVSLSHNALTSLPADDIDCPALESLDVANNRLASLPDELTEQPALTRLDLRDNPWQSLPEACNGLDVRLDIAEKRRLLDFEYRGADGQGAIAWDESAFSTQGHPQLTAALDEMLAHVELQPRCDAIRVLARRSVTFRQTGDEDYAQLGNHRFGGMPDLPPDVAYPRYGENPAEGKESYAYEFLAQIDLGAIADLQSYLPRRGMLYFFLTTVHDLYGGERPAGKALHHAPVDADERLISGQELQLDEDDYFEMMGSCYRGFRAAADVAISVPSLYASSQNPHLFRGPAQTLADDAAFVEDLSMDLLEEPMRERFPHDHEIGGYGFSQHEHPEAQAALALRGAPEDWLILLKLASAGDFQWGDAGDLFFVIHKSDLAKGDFSNVFCTLESS